MYAGLARAYFPAIGRPRDGIVVNHCGSLCRFSREQLDAVYGTGTHVLTIRDPRAVYSSMQGLLHLKFTFEHVRKGHVSLPMLERHLEKLEAVDGVSGYLREFCDDYRHMVRHYAACPDVVRLRFEDLVRAPEAALRHVAAQTGLPWNPSLLEPTELGASHAPNSSFARQGAAIHGKAADDWVPRIEPETCRYIEDQLAEEMTQLGYRRLGAGDGTVEEAAPLLGSGT
jgi:hypothetical protein